MIPARDSFAGRRQVLLTYMDQYKINSFPWVAITGLLLSLFIMTVPAGHHLIVPLILGGIGILIYIILTVLHFFSPILQMVMPMMLWFTLWAQLLTACLYRRGDSFNELLGWALYIQFVTVCTVPQSRNQLIFCSVSSMVGYLAVQCFNAWDMLEHFPTDFVLQMLTNAFLFSVATIIGISAYITWNKKIDTLYEQVIYTLFIKKAMEKQTQEEERLVLSVLPEHVAVQMRDNLGLMDTQFKKIYMSRHENVSILYADIVGFTAISSTYSAQDLVAILNELFARFDRLAEKFDQLRIKILGDCYYCISGAPVERDDHAALCVYMGLSMVKAIKYVQQITNSPVDMRVGIHTGAVLAGVLGQRQWQFDVYSRDVELANKMESSGMAGRVHISEVTLSYLNGEFEVEPAYGEKREEMLRQAGIKTYFITKVLKPHPKYADTDATDDADMTTENNSTRDEEEEEANSREAMLNSNQLTSAEQHFTEDEFISLYTSLTPEKTDYWVTFYNKEVEAEYVKQLAPCHIISTRLPFLVLPAFIIMSTFIVPVAWTHVIFFLSIVLSLVYNWYWRFFIPIKMDIPSNFTSLIVYTIIGLLVLTNFSSLIMCGLFKNPCKDMYSMSDTTPGPAEDDTARCYHSTYYYHVGVVAICATYWLRGSHMVRSLVIISIVIFNSLPALITPVEIDPKIDFDPYPYELCKNTTILNLINAHDFDMVIVTLHDYRNVLMLVFIAIALINFNAFYERQDRSRFCRHRTLLAENRHYQEKTKRNQAMVNNVLPPHVAKHFMGGQHNHRDLYSQSYSEVGVLFAAMPNFTEFYSEESVNNQGLECLRFLNEVISDFDMLLDDPRFCKHIVKIKTISSTYMAASGLGPKDKLKTSNSVVVRWAHLSWLVVFALELQRTLAAINEQSFNHFVLRLGINHGPITAGVIGARKPHYDIWGNTVNVASRMESTGKAGCIQVTSETAQILEEFGYQFEQRGLVAVKGKGELMTYYLLDKNLPKPLPIDGNPSQSKPAKTETRQVTPGPSKNETKGTSKSKW